MATEKKQATVQKIIERLTQVKGVILTDYQGLTTSQLNDLREKLRQAGGDFQVVKNTLLSRGLNQAGYPGIELEGPTAAAFVCQDVLATLQVLNQYSQANELPQIKAGFWEKEILPPDRLDRLSKIPSFEYLKGLVVSCLGSPLTNLISALNWNLNQLVYTLKQIQGRG